jgi:hypothetical protein
MKIPAPVAALGFALVSSQARAQWVTETYSLKGGWNAIFLHGDATHATPEQLFPNSGVTANVLEVWRWNPNPNQVQFTSSPLVPTPGTPEWSVWVRSGAANTLSSLTGQNAYLVRCAGNSSNSYSVSIKQSPRLPGAIWVRNGANLMGFPSRLTASFPPFSSYFTTFPAAIAANGKVFKYIGGDLGSGNPIQVFSTTSERIDRNQAYWFSSEVVGDFYAPVQVSLSAANALDFGRTGTEITALVVNRATSAITLTLAPLASESSPSGQEAISAGVPLTRRTFDPGTAGWVETPITAAYNEVIPPGGTLQLSFGINRTAMSGPADAYFASLLRLTDAGNFFDIRLPVRARKTSLAGLWIGEALVSAVESKPEADAITPTSREYPLRYILHVANDGTTRLLSQAFTGPLAAGADSFGICTKESDLKADARAGAARYVAAHLPLDRVIAAGSLSGPGSTISCSVEIPFDNPVNPFVHRYHPDHDNMDPRGSALGVGKESYTVSRALSFTFTASPPVGVSSDGWGSSVIGGNYAETISGIHKQAISVAGTFILRRVSELGTLTVN